MRDGDGKPVAITQTTLKSILPGAAVRAGTQVKVTGVDGVVHQISIEP